MNNETKREAEIRLELSINGKSVATAGISGDGVLEANVLRWKRDPAKFERVSGGAETIEEWSIEYLFARLSGGQGGRFNSWGEWGLKTGDVVTIRILGAGDADPPIDGPDSGVPPPRDRLPGS